MSRAEYPAPNERSIDLEELHETYQKARATGDIYYCPLRSAWLVMGYEPVRNALRNRDFVAVDPIKQITELGIRTRSSFLSVTNVLKWMPLLIPDADLHRRKRKIFTKVLSTISKDYERYADSVIDRLFTTMKNKEHICFAKEYADRVHFDIMAGLCGLDDETVRLLWRCFSGIDALGVLNSVPSLKSLRDSEIGIAKILDILTYCDQSGGLIPLLDVIESAMVDQGFIPASKNSKLEFLCALFLIGGDTISGTLTLGLGYLLRKNNLLIKDDFWRDTEILADEFIRIASFSTEVSRRASCDTFLANTRVAKGDYLYIVLPSANLDEKYFPEPLMACPKRSSPSFAFGGGDHVCSGIRQSKIVVRQTLKHLSKLELISQTGPAQIRPKQMAKLISLPLELKG